MTNDANRDKLTKFVSSEKVESDEKISKEMKKVLDKANELC